MNTPWRPLLSGSLRQKIEAVISGIADELAVFIDREQPRYPSLANGDAGLALFFHYLGLSRPGHPHAHLAHSFLESALASVEATDLGFDFYGGIPGIGWAYEHLCGDQADDDDLEAVDLALLKLLAEDPWPGMYDLIAGLTGTGVYALEHRPRGRSGEILERVAHHLAAGLEPAEVGLTYFTPPELLSSFERERFPRGYYNVGVAHGLPAVAAVLAAAGNLGPGGTEAQAAAREVVRWILACPLELAGKPVFPRTITPEGDKAPSRLAWCYGDAGVAGALLSTAQALGDAQLNDRACDIARRAAGLAVEVCGVKDAPICHGAGGLAHIFNRFFQATGEEVYRRAAERWLGEVLSYYKPGTGIGGFQSYGIDAWHDEPGFMTGAAGIGLVLLAAAGDVEPAWDRVLALSIPGS